MLVKVECSGKKKDAIMISQGQERLVQHLRDIGAGNTASEELMNMHHVRKTEDMIFDALGRIFAK